MSPQRPPNDSHITTGGPLGDVRDLLPGVGLDLGFLGEQVGRLIDPSQWTALFESVNNEINNLPTWAMEDGMSFQDTGGGQPTFGGGGGGGLGVNINIGGGGGGKKGKKAAKKAASAAAGPLRTTQATDVGLEGYRQRFESGLGTDEQLAAEEGSGPLASPLAKTVGRLVADSRDLLDDNSAATARFRDALTSGPLAEIESGRIGEERALGSAERTGARERRDVSLRFGSSSNPNAMAAIGARSAERFGTARAGVEERAASQRAQVLGKAAQFFEGFRRDFARDVVTTSQAFVANSAFIRDSFRTLQSAMATNIGNLLLGQQANAIQQRGQTLDMIAGVAGAALGALGAYAANRAGNNSAGGNGTTVSIGTGGLFGEGAGG